VLPATPNGLRSTLEQLSRWHGVQLDIVMDVDTSTAMKDVALSGHAFTLLPSMAVSQELLAGSLAAVPVVKPGIKRTIALSLTTQRPLCPRPLASWPRGCGIWRRIFWRCDFAVVCQSAHLSPRRHHNPAHDQQKRQRVVQLRQLAQKGR